MQALKELMIKHSILALITIVTNRELALLNCLNNSFLDSIHIVTGH
jgi:hypothetical protein